ncbi:MAG TPA: glycerol kinase [Acidimicrobiaceae bacterium]|nr:glycerol kinase [Acidimicrobiaceae bacterium]
MACVVAVDAGTTGVRSVAVDERGRVLDVAYRELTQYFPRPGWVEHDALEIRDHVLATLAEVSERQRQAGRPVAAIGITNQRETVVAWDRRAGLPRHRALVWQDRRTAPRCDQLRADGHEELVRRRTGLVLDPYFSATKMGWLLVEGGVEADDNLALGTVDAWVAWHLTGGPAGGAFVTDPSNASRTLLYDIARHDWDAELGELFGVPLHALPRVVPTCGTVAPVAGPLAENGRALAGVPVCALAGDQQSALFGQACFEPGAAKATYGTGTFVLLNVGGQVPEPREGLLTTVAWDLGGHAGGADPVYALEGAVFSTGAAIQWLRDGLGILGQAADVGPLAATVAHSEGVYVVPAFTGMGSPWWDPYARGAIVGLSRGLGRGHVARAVVESIAFQVRDVVDAMRLAGAPVETLRVDGGASVMDLLLQLQADQVRLSVCRSESAEATALGAATLAGLATGMWSSLEELSSLWRADAVFEPKASAVSADSAHAGWLGAVDRARAWARESAGAGGSGN